MNRRGLKRLPPGLYLLLGLLAGAVVIALLWGPNEAAAVFTNPAVFMQRVLWPLLRLAFFISIGVFAGQVIEGLGWTDRISLLARPFMLWAHMSHRMGAAFTTAFVSGTASLSMLMEFHREGVLTRKELTITVLLNTFPSFFLHLPTTFFVLIPLVGRAGLLYLLLAFSAAVIRLVSALAASRALLPPPSSAPPVQDNRVCALDWPRVLKESSSKFRIRIVRILMIVLPVYVIVVIASDAGLFVWLRHILAARFTSSFIPIEAFSVVLFSLVAEFTSGYAAAGAMLESGALTVNQTVLALLLGNILAAPVRALRHQLPYYMGIFTPKLGLGLMAAGQLFRLLSLALMGVLGVVMFH